MNIFNKILLVLIALTTALFVVLASNRYALQKSWEEKIQASNKKLAKVTEEIEQLKIEIYGNPMSDKQGWNELGLMAKRNRLDTLLNGKVWVDCKPGAIQKNQKSVTATFVLPDKKYDAAGVDAPRMIYIFDAGTPVIAAASADDTSGEETPVAATSTAGTVMPARFLGIFFVQSVNKSNVTAVAAHDMTEEEIAILDKSSKDCQADATRNWIIVADRAPVDSPDDVAFFMNQTPEIFKTLSAEDQKWFSAKTINMGDIADLKVDQNMTVDEKRRAAIDYNWMLDSGFISRDMYNITIARKETTLIDMNTVLVNQLASMGTVLTDEVKGLIDMKQYETAVAEQKRANRATSYKEMVDRYTVDLSRREKERDLVKARLDLIHEYREKMQARIDSLLDANNRLAVQIATVQFEAVKKIMRQNAQNAPVNDKQGKGNSVSPFADVAMIGR